jgi:hypothetical protein
MYIPGPAPATATKAIRHRLAWAGSSIKKKSVSYRQHCFAVVQVDKGREACRSASVNLIRAEINLKTTKALLITVPSALLARAEGVIE